MNGFCLEKLLIKAFFELCRLYVDKCGKVKKESNALHGHMVFLDVKKVPLDEDVGAIEHQYGCIGTRTGKKKQSVFSL